MLNKLSPGWLYVPRRNALEQTWMWLPECIVGREYSEFTHYTPSHHWIHWVGVNTACTIGCHIVNFVFTPIQLIHNFTIWQIVKTTGPVSMIMMKKCWGNTGDEWNSSLEPLDHFHRTSLGKGGSGLLKQRIKLPLNRR